MKYCDRIGFETYICLFLHKDGKTCTKKKTGLRVPYQADGLCSHQEASR